MLDEIRDSGANAAVGERRILFRHARCDVLPLSLGKTQCKPVDELPDRGIRVHGGQVASLRPRADRVNAGECRSGLVVNSTGVFTRQSIGVHEA